MNESFPVIWSANITAQGLESIETVNSYLKTFETELNDHFHSKHGRKLDIKIEKVKVTKRRSSENESMASKVKESGEPGFEE